MNVRRVHASKIKELVLLSNTILAVTEQVKTTFLCFRFDMVTLAAQISALYHLLLIPCALRI